MLDWRSLGLRSLRYSTALDYTHLTFSVEGPSKPWPRHFGRGSRRFSVSAKRRHRSTLNRHILQCTLIAQLVAGRLTLFFRGMAAGSPASTTLLSANEQ